MSLPATQTQITQNPSKNAVTSSTNPDRQQADVERKLKLYGVIQAFRDGRMPDNAQCNEALEYALNNSPIDLNKLSPDGKLLIEDFRDIIESARQMVLEKNEGELLQNFVFSTAKGDPTRGKKSKDELLPVGKGDLVQDKEQAAVHLRTLFTLFFTNSEARKLLSDVGLISRDLFATAAQKGADKLRPDQEQLEQVDKPAPSGEWIGPDGKKLGRDETPELQLKGPKGSEIRMNPKDDPKNAQVTDHQGNTRSAGQAYNEASSAYNDAKNQAQSTKEQAKGQAQSEVNAQGGTGGIKEQLKDHARDVAHSDDPKATAQAKKDQAAGQLDERTPNQDEVVGSGNKKDQLLNKIPDEHREKLNEGIEKSKDFLNENFPEERREQFIYRLKKVIVECQEHKDYQEAVNFFLEKAENYKGHAQHAAGKGGESTQAVASDPAYQTAFLQFRTLLERFSNNRSMEPLFDAIDQLYTDAANDSELRNWFSRLNDYLHAVLLEPGFILDDESTTQYNKLKEDGRHFFDHKYKGHADNLSQEIQTFFRGMADDPLNVRLGEDVRRLVKDLLFDAEGNLSFKPKLWNDVRRVLLPSLIKNIGYVPIPRAEYSDDTIDLVIENLVLQGANLTPNIIHIGNQSSFQFSPYDTIPDKSHNEITIGFSQVHADIRDCMFAFRKKKGFPKIKDSGLASVVISGTGICVDVTLETVDNRRDSVIKAKTIKTDIGTLKFSITDSNHDLLYKFVKATATGVIKRAIQAAIHGAISQAISHLDDQLVEVRNRLDEAKKSDETTRTQALKDLYARKKQTAKENAEKADEKTGTFKLVTSKEDSIVPDFDKKMHTESWTKKAFKIEDSLGKSDSWKSPVFSILHDQHPATTGKVMPGATNTTGVHGTPVAHS